MSSQPQHPLGEPRVGRAAVAGSVDGTTPSATAVARPRAPRASASWSAARRARRGRRTGRARRRRATSDHGRPGGARVHPRLGARLGDRREHPLQVRRTASGGSTRPVPAEAGGRRHLRGEHRGQRRARRPARPAARRPASRRRRSATWSRTPSASACASSRRAPWSASTLSPRGLSTVAASVHGPATWTLKAPGVALRLLLDARRGPGRAATARPAVVDARLASVSRQPAGCRSAPRPDARRASAAAGHRRGGARGRAAPAGAAGRAARRARARTASAYARSVVAGHRPDAGGERHAVLIERRPLRRLRSWPSPTTRVPS